MVYLYQGCRFLLDKPQVSLFQLDSSFQQDKYHHKIY